MEEHIENFKCDFNVLSPIEIVRKRIIFGNCVILDDNSYLSLRNKIADRFDLHPNEIIVVGSTKLGFSIAPHKRYKSFGDTSDIDVAVVSSDLFDKVWFSVYEASLIKKNWFKGEDFKNYLFQGWIRPDLFPPSSRFRFRDEWWEFFRLLTQSGEFGPYKIAGGIYKSWLFLENYQTNAVNDCINSIDI